MIEFYKGRAYEITHNHMVYVLYVPSLRVKHYCDKMEACVELAKRLIDEVD
ncbi:hypothetical protein [Metallosphaera sp.]|uniref:hypothetical protein n=1 Tax=Metallosphaera sp. TaxID=2020860 RepID=UPI0027A37B0B|nr:hypothetical protein SSRV2_ORF23 [Saccharolobus shibatae rod virus 2]